MIPRREPSTRNDQTYFVTASTWERRPLFKHERWADLFIHVLLHYRGDGYRLHEFVVMPDHFHALLSPATTLERSVQLIKGGFSRRAGVELESRMEVWQRGFSDHRIRDDQDYELHRNYIRRNPVKARLCDTAEKWKYGSTSGLYELDSFPQGLKPLSLAAPDGTAEAVPFQRSLKG